MEYLVKIWSWSPSKARLEPKLLSSSLWVTRSAKINTLITWSWSSKRFLSHSGLEFLMFLVLNQFQLALGFMLMIWRRNSNRRVLPVKSSSLVVTLLEEPAWPLGFTKTLSKPKVLLHGVLMSLSLSKTQPRIMVFHFWQLELSLMGGWLESQGWPSPTMIWRAHQLDTRTPSTLTQSWSSQVPTTLRSCLVTHHRRLRILILELYLPLIKLKIRCLTSLPHSLW